MEELQEKVNIQKEAREFGKVSMSDFLLEEVGLVPRLSADVHLVDVDSNLFDFYEEEAVWAMFEKYVGVDMSETEFKQVRAGIVEGSTDGVLDWVVENVRKLMVDEGVGQLMLARVKDEGITTWVVVYVDKVLEKKIEDVLEEVGYEVESRYVWSLKKKDLVDATRLRGDVREAIVEFLEVLKRWDKIEKWYASELEEEIEESWWHGKIRDLLGVELEEKLTLDDLYIGAIEYKKRQPGVVDRVAKGEILYHAGHVKDIKVVPYKGMGMVEFVAEVRSESEPKNYVVWIRVYDVEFSDEFTPETPLKLVDSKTGKIFYMSFLNPDSPCSVRCSCEDKYHRFSYWVKREGSWLGKLKPYRRKTPPGSRKPINVAQVPAGCKHVIAVLEALKDNRVISTMWRYGREIDLTGGVE